MKVFQVGHTYRIESGVGVAEYIYQTTEHLKSKVDIHFILFDQDDADEYFTEQLYGVTMHHFPKLEWKGFKLPAVFFKWLNGQAMQNDAIFHLQNNFYLPNYPVARSLAKKGIPYIFTPHDSYSPESMRKNWALKYTYLYAFDRWIMNKANIVHAITHAGVKNIAKYTSNKNIALVTNFVPSHSYVRTDARPRKQICYIGRFDIYQKGIDRMIAAYAKLVASYPDVDFILIGKYTQHEKDEVVKLCNSFGISESRLKLTGKISQDEKWRILCESYVYFQLSRFEGFGLSIVEALSAGKPVIITDKVPIYNYIIRSNAGYIAGTVDSAVEKLTEVLKLSPEEYLKKSEGARRCYMENFHPSAITGQLIEMYQSGLRNLQADKMVHSTR